MAPCDSALAEHLREQLEFLKASAKSYDDGFEGEAKRLATVIRILVHDTRSSKSVLGQLSVKVKMRFTDTSPPRPRDGVVLMSGGLAMMRAQMDPGGGEGRYVPPLDNLSPERIRPPVPFTAWWLSTVVTDGRGSEFNRKKLVTATANQAGGAHVDPQLDPSYEAISRGNSLGFRFESDGETAPFKGDAALASVRQIAYELDRSIREELPHLLDRDSLGPGARLPRILRDTGRNELCPCESGRKFKKCHGA